MGAGIVWQMYAKWRLGCCFGILPACCGIVVSHFSAFHLAACAVYYALKLYRIHDEAHLLSAHPHYRRHQAEVKHRLIPFII